MPNEVTSLRESSMYPARTFDKVRYADTDRQGHVNNAHFSEYFETGRVELLYHPDHPLHDEDASFVIASFHIDYRQEIHWPGTVDIGTAIIKIGTSSIRIQQALFQNNHLVATAESVIVHVKDGKSFPLSSPTRNTLQRYVVETAL